VRFVEFSVDPTDQQMFVDSVVAIPEPIGVGAICVTAFVLTARRRRVV